MKKLHDQGTAVYLISGGFKRIIERAAVQLNIPSENVFANRLLFDDEGTTLVHSVLLNLFSVVFQTLTILCFKNTVLVTPVLIQLSAKTVNLLMLYFSGHFAGFDESEPTSDSGGKTRVVKLLKAKYGYKR